MDTILTMKGLFGGGIFSSLFVAVDKKGLAHLLGVSYEVREAMVCEILTSKKNQEKQKSTSASGALPTLPVIPKPNTRLRCFQHPLTLDDIRRPLGNHNRRRIQITIRDSREN